MSVKSPIWSKTLWVNLLFAVFALFCTSCHSWLGTNQETVLSVFAGVNILLRLFTKDKLSFKE